MERLRREYDTTVSPDDVRFHPEVAEQLEAHKDKDPGRVPDEEVTEHFVDERLDMPPHAQRDYQPEREVPSYGVEDSARFGNAPRYPPKM